MVEAILEKCMKGSYTKDTRVAGSCSFVADKSVWLVKPGHSDGRRVLLDGVNGLGGGSSFLKAALDRIIATT